MKWEPTIGERVRARVPQSVSGSDGPLLGRLDWKKEDGYGGYPPRRMTYYGVKWDDGFSLSFDEGNLERIIGPACEECGAFVRVEWVRVPVRRTDDDSADTELLPLWVCDECPPRPMVHVRITGAGPLA